MIGSCDNCDRQNVPVSNGQFCGCDSTQCFICQGETDPDPYGELEQSEIVAIAVPVLAEIISVLMFISMIAVWAAIGSGTI